MNKFQENKTDMLFTQGRRRRFTLAPHPVYALGSYNRNTFYKELKTWLSQTNKLIPSSITTNANELPLPHQTHAHFFIAVDFNVRFLRQLKSDILLRWWPKVTLKFGWDIETLLLRGIEDDLKSVGLQFECSVRGEFASASMDFLLFLELLKFDFK